MDSWKQIQPETHVEMALLFEGIYIQIMLKHTTYVNLCRLCHGRTLRGDINNNNNNIHNLYSALYNL